MNPSDETVIQEKRSVAEILQHMREAATANSTDYRATEEEKRCWCEHLEMVGELEAALRNPPAADRLEQTVTDAEVRRAEATFTENAPRYTHEHDCHPHDIGNELRNSIPSEERIRAVLEEFIRARESAPQPTAPDEASGNRAEATVSDEMINALCTALYGDFMNHGESEIIGELREKATRGLRAAVAIVSKTHTDSCDGAISIPREEIERVVKVLHFAAHPQSSPHAETLEAYLDYDKMTKMAAQPERGAEGEA